MSRKYNLTWNPRFICSYPKISRFSTANCGSKLAKLLKSPYLTCLFIYYTTLYEFTEKIDGILVSLYAEFCKKMYL